MFNIAKDNQYTLYKKANVTASALTNLTNAVRVFYSIKIEVKSTLFYNKNKAPFIERYLSYFCLRLYIFLNNSYAKIIVFVLQINFFVAKITFEMVFLCFQMRFWCQLVYYYHIITEILSFSL